MLNLTFVKLETSMTLMIQQQDKNPYYDFMKIDIIKKGFELFDYLQSIKCVEWNCVGLSENEMTIFYFVTTVLFVGHVTLHLFYICGYNEFPKTLYHYRETMPMQETNTTDEETYTYTRETNAYTDHITRNNVYEMFNMTNFDMSNQTLNEEEIVGLNDKKFQDDYYFQDDIEKVDKFPHFTPSLGDDATASQLLDLLREKTQSTIVDDYLFPTQFTTDDQEYFKEYIANTSSQDSSTAVSEVDQAQSSNVNLGRQYVEKVLIWSEAQGWEAKRRTPWHWIHTIRTGFDILVHTVFVMWHVKVLHNL
ncbi:30721_t:CDS:1 [Gigaspora margarita]|uniref:30721_t:CDS:1 n=1 Tax=Gigaspora margarita TaxID=4874 RepID=A0ABN7UPG2_GIGMA|nr:30721_t:CDS:1 [Gigaspora margarita]